MSWIKNDVTGDFTASDRYDISIRRSKKNKKKFELIQADTVVHTGTLLECQLHALKVPMLKTNPAEVPAEVPAEAKEEKPKKGKTKKVKETKVVTTTTEETKVETTTTEQSSVAEGIVEDPVDDYTKYQIKDRGDKPWEGKSPIFLPGGSTAMKIEPPKDFSKDEIYAFFERALDWYTGREIYAANSCLRALWGQLKTGSTALGIQMPDFKGSHENREIELAPPQIMSLYHLKQHTNAHSVLAEALQRKPPVIQPEPFDDEGTRVICYPGDALHPVAERAFPGPSRLRFIEGRFEPENGLARLLD